MHLGTIAMLYRDDDDHNTHDDLNDNIDPARFVHALLHRSKPTTLNLVLRFPFVVVLGIVAQDNADIPTKPLWTTCELRSIIVVSRSSCLE